MSSRSIYRALAAVVAGVALGGTSFVALGRGLSPVTTSTTGAPVTTLQSTPSTSTAPEAPPVTTTTVASTTTSTVPEPGWLVLHGVGDTNFDPDYIGSFRANGYEFAFAGLGGLFLADDLTVVNLECSPSDLGTPLDKAFVFRCDPAALPIAFTNGVDVANLANNHIQDYGVEAMLDGIEQVRVAGIAPVGAGLNLDEATAPALFEIDGWTVAVLGMGGVVPSNSWLATEDRPGMASGDDTEQMVESVAAAAEVADIVIVSIHWGWELETTPRADDRARAEAMVTAGADVIFGHHPHRLGDVEFIDGRPVFWTLGNFVWPYLSVPSATTAVARVIVSPRGEIAACLIPAFIERSGQPVLRGVPRCPIGDLPIDPPARLE